MSFPDKHAEEHYILVSIKLHIGNDMDKGHYVCDVLDYITGTLWDCDDDTITQYTGYPINIYNDLSIYKKQKKGGKVCMDVLDMIVSMLCLKKYIIASSTYFFISGKSVSKEIEYITERIADFGSFKEEVGMTKIICNKIQKSTSL